MAKKKKVKKKVKKAEKDEKLKIHGSPDDVLTLLIKK